MPPVQGRPRSTDIWTRSNCDPVASPVNGPLARWPGCNALILSLGSGDDRPIADICGRERASGRRSASFVGRRGDARHERPGSRNGCAGFEPFGPLRSGGTLRSSRSSRGPARDREGGSGSRSAPLPPALVGSVPWSRRSRARCAAERAPHSLHRWCLDQLGRGLGRVAPACPRRDQAGSRLQRNSMSSAVARQRRKSPVMAS